MQAVGVGVPKTVTIDSVAVNRVQLIRDATGQVQIYAEYDLKSGSDVIRSVHREITVQVSAARKSAANGVFEAIGLEISSAELG
jgi:hypothetical protein